MIGGQRNDPCCNCFQISTRPLAIPDQDLDAVAALRAIDDDRARERILGQHLLRQGGETMRTFAKIDRSRRQQDASSGGNIDHVRDADARTARNTAVSCVASSMPAATRTTAPASLTSITGAARPWNRCRRYGLGHDRNEPACHGLRSFCRRCRHRLPHRASPTEYLLRTNLPAPSHLGHTPSRNQGLRDNLCLLFRRPATSAARSGQQLNPPKFTLRVIANVKHKDSSKPLASSKSSTSRTAIKGGRQSSAYGSAAVGINCQSHDIMAGVLL